MSAQVTVKFVQDTNFKGLGEIARRLRSLDKTLLVGVPAGAKEADGTSLAMVAAVHEFGSPERGIPERSFIRSAIAGNIHGIKSINAHSIKRMVDGTLDENTALGRLGLYVVAKIQQQIVDGSFAPLAPSTIKRKGSDKPLIDTGQLRASITYQIDAGQEGAGIIR